MADVIGTEIHLDGSFEEAVDKVKSALKEQGFGVLTSIDVKEAFKEKIGKDFRPYVILGACNPRLAYTALSEVPEVGLMLPCNVTVEAGSGGGVTVRIIDPRMMLGTAGIDDNEVMASMAAEAGELLGRVADALR